MSNSLPNKKNRFRFRFRLPPAESQVAMGLVAGLLGVFTVRLENFGLGPQLLLMALFIGGIWAKRAWMVWLMIGILIYLKYLLIYPGIHFDVPGLRFLDVVDALILIVLAATCFRLLESARFLDTFYPNTRLGEKPNSDVKFEFPSLFGGRWWAIPLAAVLAVVLLGVFPFGSNPLVQIKIKPIASRLIFMTLFLFFAWFVCRAVIGTMARWKMKPHQADVHCRSLVANELWKDAYDIEKRRAKLQAKED